MRVYEKMLARVQNAVDAAPALRRAIFAWGVRTGALHLREIEKGEKPSSGLRLKYRIADRLVFGKIKARLGGRFRFAISGGAPLAHDVAAFFWAAGVEVYEGYGLTETSPVLACNRPGEWRLGTVGRAIPGVTLRLAADGEVLAKGPNVMDGGYWRKKEETASVFDADGWFRTGDIGSFDIDEYLTLTDRKKEILINAMARTSRRPDRSRAQGRPFVSSAVDRRPPEVPVGARRPELREARDLGRGLEPKYRTRQDLVADPKVLSLFKQAIEILNGDEPHERQIRAFRLLTEDFSIEGGELTPTMKIKRRVVVSKYRDVIEEMYADASALEGVNADALESR